MPSAQHRRAARRVRAPLADGRPSALGRRAFLRAIAWGALLPLTGAAGARGEESSAFEAALLALLSDPSGAARIGRVYLAGQPEEARRELLARRLCDALGEGPRSTLRERMARCARRDFTRGDTVQLSGWLVSRSEARLCALAALASAERPG